MGRKLKNIKLKEVSLVSAPANRKRFFVIKEQKCPNCGNVLKQVRIDEENTSCIQLNCSKCGDIDNNYFKKEGTKMEELIKLLKDVFDEEVSKEHVEIIKTLSDTVTEALQGALIILAKYKADMPEDLLGSVGVLAEYATGKHTIAKEKDSEDSDLVDKVLEKWKKEIESVEKTGKKLSKDNIEKIKNVLKNLESILPMVKTLTEMLPDSTVSKDKDKDSDDKPPVIDEEKLIEKLKGHSSEEIKKVIDGIEVLTKTIKESEEKFDSRLKTLEEEKGIKKSLDDDTDDNVNTDSSDGEWPSIVNALNGG